MVSPIPKRAFMSLTAWIKFNAASSSGVSLEATPAATRGVDFEDPIDKEYTKKTEDCSIEVTIYKLKESKKSSCVAKFKYGNIEYLLTGTMKQQEFEKILNNLFFPK